jgi:hypothetical protein
MHMNMQVKRAAEALDEVQLGGDAGGSSRSIAEATMMAERFASQPGQSHLRLQENGTKTS